MFDVSLMACLLKHFTDLHIQDGLPVETNRTVAADISKIKFYRNYIVHSNNGKVTENKFSEIWSCVAEVVNSYYKKSELDYNIIETDYKHSENNDLMFCLHLQSVSIVFLCLVNRKRCKISLQYTNTVGVVVLRPDNGMASSSAKNICFADNTLSISALISIKLSLRYFNSICITYT